MNDICNMPIWIKGYQQFSRQTVMEANSVKLSKTLIKFLPMWIFDFKVIADLEGQNTFKHIALNQNQRDVHP